MVNNLVLPTKANSDSRMALNGISPDAHMKDEANVIPDVEAIWCALNPNELVNMTANLKDGFWHLIVDEQTSWYPVFHGLKSTGPWQWRVTSGSTKCLRGSIVGWHTSEKMHHSFDDLHVGMEPSQETADKLEQARNAKAQPALIKHLE